jgi:hypothetical protein
MTEGMFAFLLIAGILFIAFIIAPPKRKDEEEDNPASLRSGDVASLRDGEELVTLTDNLHPGQAESIQTYLKAEGIETYRYDKKPSLKNPLVITEIALKIKKSDIEKVLGLMNKKEELAPASDATIGCQMQPPPEDAIVVDQNYIEFNCPLCSEKVSFPENYKGNEEQCPFCLKNIVVS